MTEGAEGLTPPQIDTNVPNKLNPLERVPVDAVMSLGETIAEEVIRDNEDVMGPVEKWIPQEKEKKDNNPLIEEPKSSEPPQTALALHTVRQKLQQEVQPRISPPEIVKPAP